MSLDHLKIFLEVISLSYITMEGFVKLMREGIAFHKSVSHVGNQPYPHLDPVSAC